MMSQAVDFGETHDVSITVLVDNRADLLVKSTTSVKYFTDQPLLAEHGFAALIHLKDADVARIALLENMRRMKLDPAVIDKIVLSHGHSDHIAALTDILRVMDVAPKPKDWRADAPAGEIERVRFGPYAPPPRAGLLNAKRQPWQATVSQFFGRQNPPTQRQAPLQPNPRPITVRASSSTWTRTRNPPVNSRMLCQLSYRGSTVPIISKTGCASNQPR